MFGQDSFDSLVKKGQRHMEKGEYIKSKEMYLKALAIDPDSLFILNNLSQICILINDENKAKGYGELLLKTCDDKLKYETTEELLLFKSNALICLDRKNEANETYGQLLKINPNNYVALLQKSIFHEDRGEPEKALEYLERILEIDRYDIPALLAKGRNLVSMNDFKKAEECYNLVIQIEPKNREAIYLKSVMLQIRDGCAISSLNMLFHAIGFWQRGHLEESDEFFRLALQIDDSHSEIWFSYGELLIRRGKISDAVQCFKKAFELNPQIGGITRKNAFFRMLGIMRKINTLFGYEKE